MVSLIPQELLSTTKPYLLIVVRAIGIGGFAGASLALSMMSDSFSLLTFHLHIFYIAAARIYHWQLTILISLFHLFRSKKRNVLRHRIDSCDYDLDQLLLGTILFTLLVFLFPTVLVFYLTYATSRLAIKFAKTTIDCSLAFLNRLPLFAVLLRIKDAKRLPGGVSLTLLESEEHKSGSTQLSSNRVSYLWVEVSV